MKVNIDWCFFFEVNSEQKAKKLIEKISASMGLPFDQVKAERYWKDKALFRVGAKSKFEVATPKDELYEIMMTAGRIARAWTVSAPSEEDILEFGGTTQPGSVRIPGVDSISFRVVRPESDQEGARPPRSDRVLV